MSQKQYVFENADDYDFDSDFVEIGDGIAKLKLATGQESFAQEFSADTDFVYDSTLAEFVGGVLRQIDKRPSGATLGASYSSSVNASWASTGSLTGTANNGASVSGGKLDLSGGSANKSVVYDGTGRVGIQQGALRLKWTPNYNGVPTDGQYFFYIAESEGSPNSNLALFHHPNGSLFLYGSDKDGVGQLSNSILVFDAVAGVESELEVSWDLDTGKVYVFGNGYLIADIDITFDRSACSYLRIGGSDSGNTNSYFDDVIFYSAPLHSANYTPGYSVPDAAFVASNAILPEMAYAGGDGSFLEVTDFDTVETNSPRYSVQIGRNGTYLYWNGSAWTASNGTYSQASSQSDVADHASTLPVDGQEYIQIKVHFQNSNVLQSIDSLGIEVLESTTYTIEPKTVTPNGRFEAERLVSFNHSVTTPEDTYVRYILEIDSVRKYWNGTLWRTSNGSFSQSNTKQEVEDHIVSLLDGQGGHYIKLLILLKTDNPSASPSIASATIQYEEFIDGMRGYMNSIFQFIEAESLTDEEYDSIQPPLTDINDDVAVYDALLSVLQSREDVSDEIARLTHYFQAKGAAVVPDPSARSHILVGSGL